MSEYAEGPRAAMKAKARRLGMDDSSGPYDASRYKAPGNLNADIKVGMRPVSRQHLKAGGKVEGETKDRPDKKPRGGLAKDIALQVANLDEKEANKDRPGANAHVGGFKRGGRPGKQPGGAAGYAQANQEVPTSRMNFSPSAGSVMSRAAGLKRGGEAKGHDDEKSDRKLVEKMVKPEARTGKDDGGRSGRANGGRTGKGKMNVNIIISQPPAGGAPAGPPPGGPPPAGPGGVPVAMPGGPPAP